MTSSPELLARRLAMASMAISAGLAVVKIAVGLIANSVALTSDGFESAADFFTAGLVLLALWVAAKPPDHLYLYGHGRFETLIGMVIGVILVATGVAISVHALEERYVQHHPALYVIWPLIASVALKSGLSMAKFRFGKRSGSASLTADAWNDLVDVLSGGVALIAVFVSIAFQISSADHYGGFAIGLIVIFLGVRVVRETVLQLMDTMPDEAQMAQIRAAAMRVQGALGIEKCFARKTGLRYHVDLHLEVDPGLTVRQSHEIARKVKNTIKSDVGWVQDVLIHVEPHGEM